MRIEVFSEIPRAMGLGGSAAVAVAIIRALDRHFELGLVGRRRSTRSPSSASASPTARRRASTTPSPPSASRWSTARAIRREIDPLELPEPITFVIGMTGVESLTAKMVARVRDGRERNRDVYDTMFKGIDAVTLQALEAHQTATISNASASS